jgi:ribonuclease R
VHIADVSHFVPAGSALDDEARERSTSIYLPDRVIPMLPEVISNNLASLQPGKVRFTKTAFIEFTADGARVGAEFYDGAIKSDRRFTYEEVDEYLADRESWRKRLDEPVHSLLARMHELAMILRQRRLAAGSIELSLRGVKIDLDRRGEVIGAHLEKNTESHQIIEEFMLAANEAVAEFLTEKQVAFLRRIHPLPDPRKLRALTEFVKELGISCESLESRHEIRRVIAAVAGRPEEHAVNFATLRSMAKAIYSPEEEGHYALHSKNYCHFTSPIRRYPDLTVHRLIESFVSGRRPASDVDHLILLGEHCSEREQRAEKAERELTKVKLLSYLNKRIGEEMEAVITGVEKFGLFAQGVELPAEGLIHISALQDDYYRYDQRSHSLVGMRAGNSFRLGDLIRVEVARVDIDRRELDFRIVKRLKGAPSPKMTTRPRKTKGAPSRRTKGRSTRTGRKKP